ncbi:glycosyltransferase [Marinovum sp. SP66]|uniref:TIGR04282 family arsenosugar biosynthesis glycosyltransferase n=1 Tax=Marinovum TaxID=367771 RepID=UPI00237A485C|nr:TIGR04282 family arsenosugar biosynthesis glycosyltransferase [Marinovum sp. SP66]MDD9740576.1 glycosyltransferase [Marinovum sp. SP66]
MKPTLIVMLKEPRPGRVKTRLGRDIGMGAAAWWFRHQTGRLLRRLEDPRWQLILAVAPDRDGLQSRVWPAHLQRLPQGGGDLGARMARVFRSLPPGPACIIGGDIPGVTPAHVARAFAALGGHDAAFGPAPDGGYWLIGLRHPGRAPAGFLTGVRWSTEHAMADSIATLPGHRIARVDRLADVDTAADLAPVPPN